MTAAAFLRHLLFCAGLAALSAAVVRGMIAVAVLDRPDPRKAHTRPVPKGGGVGVVAAERGRWALLAKAFLVEWSGAAGERLSAWSQCLQVRVRGSRGSVCVDPA